MILKAILCVQHFCSFGGMLLIVKADDSRFRCRIFHCFAYFVKLLLDYNQFLSFIRCPLVTALHLESFENSIFELDFSISKKRISSVKRSQEDEYFLHRYEIFFFEILSPFHMSKH